MSHKSVVIRQIKGAIPISRLAGTTKNRVPCPFHHSKDPDLALNHITNTWRCYGKCGASGDVFQWVMLDQNVTFPEAVKILAEMANISTQPPKDRIDILIRAMSSYRNNLKDSKRAQAYLKARGLHEETWFKANLGYANSRPPEGLTRVELEAVGLYNAAWQRLHFKDRIVFAVHNQFCDIVHMQSRALDPEEQRFKYLMLPSDTINGSFPIGHYLHGEEQLMHKPETLFLNEGIPDALTIRQWGLPALAVLGKQSFHIHAYKLQRLAYLYVLMDNDEASQSVLPGELLRMQAKMPRTTIYAVTLPKQQDAKKMDVNQWYLDTGATVDDFQEMIAQNRIPALRLVIDTYAGTKKMHPLLAEAISGNQNEDYWVEYLAHKARVAPDAVRYLIETVAIERMSSLHD